MTAWPRRSPIEIQRTARTAAIDVAVLVLGGIVALIGLGLGG